MRSPFFSACGDAGVEAVDVAHADLRHLAVAVLHLADRPLQRDDRLLRVGDDGGQKMRDAVIDGELQHLRVDHDQAAFGRRHAVEQRQDHGVDGDRLARAGGAGDQHVRHLGDVDDDGLAVDRLAERQRQLGLGGLEIAAGEDLAQIDRLALGVGQLDADGVAAGHHGDARGDRAHRAGDVVGEADDARRLDAGGGLQLVERDDRAGADMDDLALDAEILEHAFEQPRVLLQRVLGDRIVANDVLRLGEEMQRRHLEFRRADQRGLRLALDAGAGSGTRRGSRDAGRGVGAEVAHLAVCRRTAGSSSSISSSSIVEIVVDVDRVDGHGAVGNHGGEELRLDPGAAVGADAGFGALGRFDALGSAAPAACAVAFVDLELVVTAIFRRGAAQESPRRQPPMGDGAERQDAAIVFLVFVEGGFFLDLLLWLGGRQDGEAVLACVETGAIGEKIKRRADQQHRQKVARKPVG